MFRTPLFLLLSLMFACSPEGNAPGGVSATPLPSETTSDEPPAEPTSEGPSEPPEASSTGEADPTTGAPGDEPATSTGELAGPPPECSPDRLPLGSFSCELDWRAKALEVCAAHDLNCDALSCVSPCETCDDLRIACLKTYADATFCLDVEAQCLYGLHDVTNCFCLGSCQPAPGLRGNIVALCETHGFACETISDATPCSMCEQAAAFASAEQAGAFTEACAAKFPQCACLGDALD
jgi:hypothetical protein